MAMVGEIRDLMITSSSVALLIYMRLWVNTVEASLKARRETRYFPFYGNKEGEETDHQLRRYASRREMPLFVAEDIVDRETRVYFR